MPNAPQSKCSYTGCTHPAVPHGGGKCAIHHKAYERLRGSSSVKGYIADWLRVRMAKLYQSPFCEVCGDAAAEVHHIKPLADGGSHAFDNLQSLCKRCNSRITAKEHRSGGANAARGGK